MRIIDVDEAEARFGCLTEPAEDGSMRFRRISTPHGVWRPYYELRHSGVRVAGYEYYPFVGALAGRVH